MVVRGLPFIFALRARCCSAVPPYCWAAGVGQLLACSRMFGPIFPLLYVLVLQSGVAQYFVWLSSPTVRFWPFSIMPLLATSSAGTDRPPFGTFGVSQCSPSPAKPPLPPMAGTHAGR